MNPTYLGELELSEATLAHYGVKGMKWRRRKVKDKNHKAKDKKRPGIDTDRDLRFTRQGNGMTNDPRFENKYSKEYSRYYRAKTKRNRAKTKTIANRRLDYPTD